MNAYGSRLFFHRMLAAFVLLSLPVISSLPLGGDDPRAGKASNQTSAVAESAEPSSGELLKADLTQQESNELRSLLRALTDQQLVVIAKGGEPPPRICQLIEKSSARMNEELLAELARRWDRQFRSQTVAEAVTEEFPVVASEAPVEEHAVIDGPPKPIEVKMDRVVVEAVFGTPFNVGVMELTFAKGHGPILYPDQPLYLDTTVQPAHYETFDVTYQEPQGASRWQVDRLRVSFLHQGGGPGHLSLSGIPGFLLASQKVESASKVAA